MMKRLALWAIGLILIATNALSQNNTYNMVITMSNGTTISIGPNEVKDITFNDGEIQVTGQTLEQVVGQIGTNRIRIDSLSVVTDKLQYLMKSELTDVKALLQARIEEVEGMLMRQFEKQINDLKAQIKDLEEKVAQQGGATANDAVAVDLGLPSGTKWADRNVGASKAEEYGGYYAWGETEEKDVYDWSSYIHCDGSEETCHDIGSDISGTQYDVAHVKWGGAWKMPTEDQMKELIDNCTSYLTTVNGVNGRRFTGPNGKSIFLPAAGYNWDGYISFAGSEGYYWLSTLRENYPTTAYFLKSDARGTRFDYFGRGGGLMVRPVR